MDVLCGSDFSSLVGRSLLGMTCIYIVFLWNYKDIYV